MYCQKCGTQHDAKFCPECGTPVQESFPSFNQAPTQPNTANTPAPQFPPPQQPVAPSQQPTFPNQQPAFPSQPLPFPAPPAKKKLGCLKISLLVFFGPAILLSLFIIITNPTPKSGSNSTSTASSTVSVTSKSLKTMTSDELLAFDAETWEIYTDLYINYQRFHSHFTAFANGQISIGEMYTATEQYEKYCKNKYSEIIKLSKTAEAEDIKTYYAAFEGWAISGQTYASELKKYLDSGKASDLSSCEKQLESLMANINNATSNRGILLRNTDLTAEEITAKIEQEFDEIESKI